MAADPRRSLARTPARERAPAPPTAPSHQASNKPSQGGCRLYASAPFLKHMPANKFNGFTDYGIGIGLRIPHYAHIFEKKPVVDWFEIISENYMIDGGRPLETLDRILENYRVVQHGVSMYFGSAEPLNRDHLRRLKALVKRTRTPWLTDHLCWGSVDGTYTHDLLPMPYTFEAAEITARKVREACDFLELPISARHGASGMGAYRGFRRRCREGAWARRFDRVWSGPSRRVAALHPAARIRISG